MFMIQLLRCPSISIGKYPVEYFGRWHLVSGCRLLGGASIFVKKHHVSAATGRQTLLTYPDHDSMIYLTTKVLNLGNSQLLDEKNRIIAELDLEDTCSDCFSYLDSHLRSFRDSILSCISTENSTINEIARYIFITQSKLFRPSLGLLVARILRENARCDSSMDDSDSAMENVMKLLQSYEIVHVGSLIHDDILDDADTRRNIKSVHKKVGTKLAVLVGDLLLTRACSTVASMGCVQITLRMAKALENLIKVILNALYEFMMLQGEIKNVTYSNCLESMLKTYLDKIFLKTASLMAECCASVASVLGCSPAVSETCYLIGLHAGMAFQICDDILDYTSKSDMVRKPTLKDISLGLITMPLLFAIPDHKQQLSSFEKVIQPEFKDKGPIVELVNSSFSFERSKCALLLHVEQVVRLLKQLNDSEERCNRPLPSPSRALARLIFDTVNRTKG